MKRASLLLIVVIAAVTLAACEGQQIGQCDPPGANCYRQGRPLQNQ
jgi:hypothetical protein